MITETSFIFSFCMIVNMITFDSLFLILHVFLIQKSLLLPFSSGSPCWLSPSPSLFCKSEDITADKQVNTED